MRAEIQKLKEQGLPVKEIIKEVTKITKIEPVKEITKEKITEIIPSEELTQIKTQLSQFSLWGTDIENLRNIAKKLQANPVNTNVPTAPIYIGSQGIQVGGSGIFSSLGVSGSAGISNLGVGGSATIGSTASDKLTVAGKSEFNAPVTAKAGLTVGTGTLTIGFIRQPLNYWGNLN
ncbi:hypothetical protein KKH59_04260 [Patescibacteria group bacterium]|nr:hypothetical protein [Patescibacteria group bacterium]